MKINIELELRPHTERPDLSPEDFNERFQRRIIFVLCRKKNFFGELIYSEAWPAESGYDAEEEYAENDEGYFKIPWSEVDGWIAVTELKEQVMKASGV